MLIRSLSTIAFVLFLGACTTPTPTPPVAADVATPPDTMTSVIVPSDTLVVNTPLESAVMIALAMKQFPTQTDSILRAYGLTPKTHDELMNRVNQDQKMRAEFLRRTQ